MKRSFLFSAIIGFSGGLILAEFWRPDLIISAGIVLTAGSLIATRRLRMAGVIIFSLMAGLMRWQAWTATTASDVEHYIGQQVLISGDVLDAPTIQANRQEFELNAIRDQNRKLAGKISIRLPAYPEVKLGQRLSVRCELKSFSDRSAIRQRSHDVRAYCVNTEIIEATKSPPSPRLTLGMIKDWAIGRISRLTEPQSSLLIGILLGRQVPMADELTDAFRATGTTHIIALSGFNVTIMITAISALLIRLVGRKWSWLPAGLVVVGFIVMTGASASVTRAGVMATIVLLAGRLGRPVSMLRLLGYTFLIMTWHNPLILIHDLGFQLSFLATIGLVYVSPAIQHLLRFMPPTLSIRENLGTTLGAIIMTEPLLLWNFARVSVVAPLVNVMVLPLIPLAMALGFLQLLLPFTWPLADGVLRLIIGAIRWGASLPFALQDISGWGLSIVAGVIMLLAGIFIYRTNALKTAAV